MLVTPVAPAESATTETAPAEPPTIELEYLAVCIAEQVVRITLLAARRQQANDQALTILSQPLMALATSLGILDQVRNYVADALPDATL